MPNQTSGIDLKIERVRTRATAKALADQLGVTRQRVSAIEALGVVNDDLVARYRDALMSLTSDEDKTPLGAASAA